MKLLQMTVSENIFKITDNFMESYRYGDQAHPTFRTRRLHAVNGEWYFDTREGVQLGPYRDKSEAEKALSVFLANCLLDVEVRRPDFFEFHYGAQDGIEHMVEETLAYFTYSRNQGQTAALAWANNRLKNITKNINQLSSSQERMDVIQYAMDLE